MAKVPGLAGAELGSAYQQMPYQVRLDSFIVVTSGLVAAVRLFDDLSADYPGQVSVHDMDGSEISIETLRQAVQDNSP